MSGQDQQSTDEPSRLTVYSVSFKALQRARARARDVRYSLLMAQAEGADVVRRCAMTHSDLFIAVGGDDVPVVR